MGAGDLVEFPKGMKVTWDVTEALNKHYHLDE
ncbi:cupin domain-containing protein [Klebsiella pneumoniae]